jgi:hypothetical protein
MERTAMATDIKTGVRSTFPTLRKTVDEDEITPNQAAEILKMSRPSVLRLIERGYLHPCMVHTRHITVAHRGYGPGGETDAGAPQGIGQPRRDERGLWLLTASAASVAVLGSHAMAHHT